MEKHGIAFDDKYLKASAYYSIKSGYDSMHDLMTRADRPTAVIASDDYSAIGAMQAVRDLRLSIPEDVSLVGFDGIEITQRFSPQLTTIKQDTKGIGAKAAESLIKQILGFEQNKLHENIVLEPQLLIGNSTKRI